jgi:hypothetical protein
VGNVARNCHAIVGRTLLNGATFGANVVVLSSDLVGFNGVAPVAKAASAGIAVGTDAAVVNALVTVLRNLGLASPDPSDSRRLGEPRFTSSGSFTRMAFARDARMLLRDLPSRAGANEHHQHRHGAQSLNVHG